MKKISETVATNLFTEEDPRVKKSFRNTSALTIKACLDQVCLLKLSLVAAKRLLRMTRKRQRGAQKKIALNQENQHKPAQKENRAAENQNHDQNRVQNKEKARKTPPKNQEASKKFLSLTLSIQLEGGQLIKPKKNTLKMKKIRNQADLNRPNNNSDL